MKDVIEEKAGPLYSTGEEIAEGNGVPLAMQSRALRDCTSMSLRWMAGGSGVRILTSYREKDELSTQIAS